MTSYASVTEGKLLSAKYRGIKLRFVEHKDTTAEDIVKGLKSRCNVVDVETVQPMPGRGNWIVVFSREEIAENCLGGITINGEELIPKRVAKSRFVHASVSFVPPDVSHEELVDALEEFATVIDIKHQYMRDYPHIKTGKRLVTLKPNNTLPPYVDVAGVRASLNFQGRIACCPYCEKATHLGRDCPNKLARKLCFHCKKPGHFKRECPELNKRRPRAEENAQSRTENPSPARPEPSNDNDEDNNNNNDNEQAVNETDADADNEESDDDSNDSAMDETTANQEETTDPATSPATHSPPFDLLFAQDATPVLFSAPSQEPEKPSPPVLPIFDIPAKPPVYFKPPTTESHTEARHKLPPVVPYNFMGEKRQTTSESPRSGLGTYGKHSRNNKYRVKKSQVARSLNLEAPKQKTAQVHST